MIARSDAVNTPLMINDSTLPATPWTRRRILGWGSAGAAGSLMAYITWPSRPSAMAQGTRREDFLPHLNSTFRLDAAADCTLVEVTTTQEHHSPSGQFKSFSLLFMVPAGFAAQSKIHELHHAQMGAMDLFLSPVGHGQQHLEAVFSQRV
jgi:hypothetical protein